MLNCQTNSFGNVHNNDNIKSLSLINENALKNTCLKSLLIIFKKILKRTEKLKLISSIYSKCLVYSNNNSELAQPFCNLHR